MQETAAMDARCSVRSAAPPSRRERGVLLVTLLTAAMMVVEIAVGYVTGSMALLADGWHMATHFGALGLASVAYALSRRFAGHSAFVFGTGKINALAGYTSALLLGIVALGMVVESVSRLLAPHPIDFSTSLPVAVVGLVVNLLSVFLLHAKDEGGGHAHGHGHGHGHAHGHEHEHAHAHGHEHAHALVHERAHGPEKDHNHRAAFVHVLADTLTSALAIFALLLGRYFAIGWVDPAMGIVGGVVIVLWGKTLVKDTSFELLDVMPSSELERRVRSALEAAGGVRVQDLHVWSLGGQTKSCVVTIECESPERTEYYRALLAPLGLAHLTIEVRSS